MEQGDVVGDLQIAGFWRRVGAFVFDVIVLGLFGLLIGALLFEPLARAGGYALIPGFAIALAYYGVGNSRMMDGQTLGKKVAGIRVVDKQGSLLDVPRSMMRYVILGTPYFLSCLPLAVIGFNPVAYAITAVSGAGQLVLIYLLVFNRRTRQSLHDAVLGTYVVRATKDAARLNVMPVWRGHWVVVGLIVALVLASPLVTLRFLGGHLGAMMPVLKTLMAQPHVRTAALNQGSFSMNGHAPTHMLTATIQLDEPWVEHADVARQFADIIGASPLDLSGDDKVMVWLNYGYNMGIARGTRTHGYAYRPGELVPLVPGDAPAAAAEH